MKLSSRMAKRFILYLLSLYSVLFISATVLFVIFIVKGLNGFYAHDIRVLESYELEEGIKIDEEAVELPTTLIDLAARSGGFLQVLNPSGQVIYSSHEHDRQVSYNFKELLTMSEQERIYTWLLEDDYTIVFRKQSETDVLLETIVESEQFPNLSAEVIERLDSKNAVFERYSETGSLQDSWGASDRPPLVLKDILQVNASANEQKEILSYKILENGDIVTVRMDNAYFDLYNTQLFELFKPFIIGFFVYHFVLLLFAFLFSLWAGNRFGKPILYFLKWIERLSKNDYERPADKKIRDQQEGRLKKKYRLFEEVDHSLFTLSTNLQKNERKIQQTEKLREDWITGLSHDLKTPLSSIYGYAMMLNSEHDWSQEEVKDFATTMTEKAAYMDELINDLTYTYQLKNEGVQLDKKEIVLQDYLQDYLEQECDHSHIQLESLGAHTVQIDPIRFERVLNNIVGNAIKHNPPKTPIYVQVSEANDEIILTVRDEGVGMPAEQLDNLFNRYYRGTNTTTDETGTGLGMTIAKQLIEAHGGKVTATSENQKGTSVVIYLPKIS